jgi:hypothetical protein
MSKAIIQKTLARRFLAKKLPLRRGARLCTLAELLVSLISEMAQDNAHAKPKSYL